MKYHLSNPDKFVHTLQEWFRSAARPLPWREHYDPYSVWISEIMLQQTQMERGVRYYVEWMRRFPTLDHVANADETAILAAWEGLGYYSRARNLHKAAKTIISKHNSVFPRNTRDILALPGIGEYTAGAIASIAFNAKVPAVDANVLRIFARLCDIDQPVASAPVRQGITELVRSLLPDNSPRVFNQALMELGALICAKRARCGECPVIGSCAAHANNTVGERPILPPKKAGAFQEMAAVMLEHDGLFAVRQRPDRGLWANMWEFPCGQLFPGEHPAAAAARLVEEVLGRLEKNIAPIATVQHGYINTRVVLHGYRCVCATAPGQVEDGIQWVPSKSLRELPFPAGQRKLLEHLQYKRQRAVSPS